MTALIGLVSGTYNRLDLLKQMLQSFRDNLLPGIQYTITIVDGGSTDGTIEWCKSQSDIQLIEDGALLGAISAFTRGALATDAKYVLLANDDVTFFDNSIIPAIVHLENNLKCGAVAFRDNRPTTTGYSRADYKTNNIGGVRDGKRVALIYAQVGLFRKWLGNRLHWWLGEHDEMAEAATYGGDNTLSAQIWRYGYSVDEVPECAVEDHIANDELRQVNYRKGLENDDSQYFTRQYDWSQGGIVVPSEPQIPQQDRRAARILYLPVYEPGWEVQKHPVHGKHGLRDALARAKNKYGATHIVQEFDYLASDPKRLRQQLIELVDSFQPDLILTQIQAHLPISAAMLAEIRQRTGATIINWNGDQAYGGLASPEMLALLQHVDLQLITNLDAVQAYEKHGIKWAYWQIGYEESEGDLEQNVRDYFAELGRSNPFDSDEQRTYPVVYLASLRSPERFAIAEVVRGFGGLVEEPGSVHATLYNFSTSALLYRRARVIISDNGFTSRGFVSNRLFQALASGGGVVLQQHVDGLDELTGLEAGKHYLEWTTLDDLREIVRVELADEYNAIGMIAQRGTAFVRENFSFDAQVAKLMTLIKERLGESEPLANSVTLMYKGKSTSGFGLGNMWSSGMRYEYQAGKHLYVKAEDVDEILRYYPDDWERMEV